MLYLCFPGTASPLALGENCNLYPGFYATSHRDKEPSFHQLSRSHSLSANPMIPILFKELMLGNACSAAHICRVGTAPVGLPHLFKLENLSSRQLRRLRVLQQWSAIAVLAETAQSWRCTATVVSSVILPCFYTWAIFRIEVNSSIVSS